MKSLFKPYEHAIQTSVAFLFGPILMVVMMALQLGEKGVYLQGALIFLAVLSLSFYLWKRKKYSAMKTRLISALVLVLIVFVYTKLQQHFFVEPQVKSITNFHKNK